MTPGEKTVLTTGEVAKICNVAPRTVSKWFDTGQLRGYRIPGSKDRRIPVDQLVRFMRAHGIPLNGLDEGRTRVLLIESDTDLSSAMRTALIGEGFEAVTASTAIEAGAAAVEHRPHVVVVDVSDADLSLMSVLRFFRAWEGLTPPTIIASADGTAQKQRLLQLGFDAVLPKPFAVGDIIRIIEDHAPQAKMPQLV